VLPPVLQRFCDFLQTVLFNVRQSLSVDVCFRRLFHFAEVVPRIVYPYIGLESAVLEKPNNVAGYVTDYPARRSPSTRIYTLSKSEKSPILQLFPTDCHSVQSLQIVNKW
jgi:hypothetical protein